MFDGLTKFLALQGIDIQNCCGHSYDNVSAMSRRYNGPQAKVPVENNLAAWIHCAGHSLNVVGKAAAEFCQDDVAFLVFFTASTHCYKVLTDILTLADGPVCVPKRVTITRLSCKVDATKALSNGIHTSL